eukprot:816202-Pelagomonas_calceolata.AAC.3
MSDTIPTPSLSLPSANVLGRAQGHKSTLQHRYFKVATTLKGRAQFRSKLSYAPFGAASVPKTLGLLLLGGLADSHTKLCTGNLSSAPVCSVQTSCHLLLYVVIRACSSPAQRFHVDDLSSAHVYLRLPEGMGLDDIPKDTLEDCCQLVKHNSIQGEGRNKPDP